MANIYDWYKIFNLNEFSALGLVSQTYSYNMEGIGLKDVLVTQGNEISMLFEDVFLILNFNEKNPFEFNSRAIYKDANNDVFLGIEVEE